MKTRVLNIFTYAWYALLFPTHMFLTLIGRAVGDSTISTIVVVVRFILYHAILSPYCDDAPGFQKEHCQLVQYHLWWRDLCLLTIGQISSLLLFHNRMCSTLSKEDEQNLFISLPTWSIFFYVLSPSKFSTIFNSRAVLRGIIFISLDNCLRYNHLSVFGQTILKNPIACSINTWGI